MKIYKISLILLFINFSCGSNSSYNNNGHSHVEEVEEICPECNGKGTIISCCSECNGEGSINISCPDCIGKGHKTSYISGMRPTDCSTCGGSGKGPCQTCDGYNRCNICNGRGSYQCTVCKGYGIVELEWNNPDSWIECSQCDGTGYAQCIACDGSGECYDCYNGISDCPICLGSGTYGTENYSETHLEECSSCNGSGVHRKVCSGCRGAGNYRNKCDNCNGSGKVVKTIN